MMDSQTTIPLQGLLVYADGRTEKLEKNELHGQYIIRSPKCEKCGQRPPNSCDRKFEAQLATNTATVTYRADASKPVSPFQKNEGTMVFIEVPTYAWSLRD